MTAPSQLSDLFALGGESALPSTSSQPFVPVEWALQHPSTRQWFASAFRTGSFPTTPKDSAIQLDQGYEGVILYWRLVGSYASASTYGAPFNAPGWQLLLNGGSVFIGRVGEGTGSGVFGQTTSNIMELPEGDGMGNTWAKLRIPIPEQGNVQVAMTIPVATTTIGWTMMGAFWPTTLRDEWNARGWKGAVIK